MFELTIIFKHEMIGIWQRFQRNFELKWNFELTMFELSVPDLYQLPTVDIRPQNMTQTLNFLSLPTTKSMVARGIQYDYQRYDDMTINHL